MDSMSITIIFIALSAVAALYLRKQDIMPDGDKYFIRRILHRTSNRPGGPVRTYVSAKAPEAR